MTKRNLIAAVLAVLLVAGIVFAGVTETHYARLKLTGSTPAAVAAQSSSTTAQSAVWSSTPIDPHATNGNPKVVVDGKLSTSGGTCVVYFGRYAYDGTTYTLLGVDTGTLTASTTQTDSGLGSALYYMAVAPVVFDTYGCDAYDVRMGDPSASGYATIIHYAGFSAPR